MKKLVLMAVAMVAVSFASWQKQLKKQLLQLKK